MQELKSKFDNAMPEGLKEVDAGFARAKRLEDAFERNEHYNPNFVGLPLNNGWVVDNPLLSAGLSSAAYNNLRNKDYERLRKIGNASDIGRNIFGEISGSRIGRSGVLRVL